MNALVMQEERSVAYQGDHGANSEAALEHYFGMDMKTVSCATFRNVLDAVCAGSVDYGVLPVENSITGIITQVQDLLDRYDVRAEGEVELKIIHNLLGLPGTEIVDIRDVYSHEQALMQCAGFLDTHPSIARHEYVNTASAARYIAAAGEASKAAIASRRAAEIYGLKILEPDISVSSGNSTRFVIVSAR